MLCGSKILKRRTSAQLCGGTDLIPPTDMTTVVPGSPGFIWQLRRIEFPGWRLWAWSAQIAAERETQTCAHTCCLCGIPLGCITQSSCLLRGCTSSIVIVCLRILHLRQPAHLLSTLIFSAQRICQYCELVHQRLLTRVAHLFCGRVSSVHYLVNHSLSSLKCCCCALT